MPEAITSVFTIEKAGLKSTFSKHKNPAMVKCITYLPIFDNIFVPVPGQISGLGWDYSAGPVLTISRAAAIMDISKQLITPQRSNKSFLKVSLKGQIREKV